MCYTLPFKLYHTYCRTSIYAEKKGLNAFFSAYRGFLHALPSRTQQNAALRRVLLTRAGEHIAACGSYMRRAACRPTARFGFAETGAPAQCEVCTLSQMRRCSCAGYGKEIESRGVEVHFYPKVMLAFSTLFLRRTLRLSPCTSLPHTAKRRASEGTADPRGRAYSCLRQLYASGGLPPDRPFRRSRNGRARAVRSLHFVPNAA